MAEVKSDRNVEAIARILSLTREGVIEWAPEDAGNIGNKYPDNIIDTVFTAQFKDKILRTFRRRYKAEKPDPFASLFATQLKNPKLVWHSQSVLEIVDEDRLSLWQFPTESMINDLHTAIKYKVSGADDLITSLLDE